MSRAAWFPVALIVLDLLAAVGYAAEGDARRALYWFAAAVLTEAATGAGRVDDGVAIGREE